MTKQDLLSHEPAAVLRYFYELSQIPRESGNEQGVREYLLSFAQDHGLWHATDAVGNVVIRKPGTAGAEDAQSIAMQGHMDMVCVKDDDYGHDFAKDPIKLQVTGDSLSAEGMTLGADNGIAVAMILAIFDDKTLTHGPLEGIFTVSEETGLDGAFGLDIANVNSRRLINLDSEEEGVFYIGCAGGGEVVGSLEAEWEGIPAGSEAWDITLSGFIGGHSGAEIHTGKGNAIKAGTRLLKLLCRQVPLRIASISSGTKRNVIPSTFYCTCILPKGSESLVREAVSTISDALKAELGTADPGTTVTAAEGGITPESSQYCTVGSGHRRAHPDSQRGRCHEQDDPRTRRDLEQHGCRETWGGLLLLHFQPTVIDPLSTGRYGGTNGYRLRELRGGDGQGERIPIMDT